MLYIFMSSLVLYRVAWHISSQVQVSPSECHSVTGRLMSYSSLLKLLIFAPACALRVMQQVTSTFSTKGCIKTNCSVLTSQGYLKNKATFIQTKNPKFG